MLKVSTIFIAGSFVAGLAYGFIAVQRIHPESVPAPRTIADSDYGLLYWSPSTSQQRDVVLLDTY
jgi:hypothetical protein